MEAEKIMNYLKNAYGTPYNHYFRRTFYELMDGRRVYYCGPSSERRWVIQNVKKPSITYTDAEIFKELSILIHTHPNPHSHKIV